MIRRTKERRRTKNSNRPHQTGKTSFASNAPPLSNPSNAALPRCRVDGGLRTRGGRSSRGGLSPSSSIHRPKARERRARRGQACSGAAGLVLLLCDESKEDDRKQSRATATPGGNDRQDAQYTNGAGIYTPRDTRARRIVVHIARNVEFALRHMRLSRVCRIVARYGRYLYY